MPRRRGVRHICVRSHALIAAATLFEAIAFDGLAIRGIFIKNSSAKITERGLRGRQRDFCLSRVLRGGGVFSL